MKDDTYLVALVDLLSNVESKVSVERAECGRSFDHRMRRILTVRYVRCYYTMCGFADANQREVRALICCIPMEMFEDESVPSVADAAKWITLTLQREHRYVHIPTGKIEELQLPNKVYIERSIHASNNV